MKITNLKVNNFRGIKNCDITFSESSNIVCIVGSGDSTKTTLLSAIEWVLWPSWSLQVADSDFYECAVADSIIIEISLIGVPKTLLTQEKFGLFLRSGPILSDENDEPIDDHTNCITIRLSIESDFEPHREVVCNRKEPKPISNRDRQLLSLGVIGQNSEKDFTWNRYSVLQRYAESKGVIKEALISSLRDASNHADLSELDTISDKLVAIGKDYGVGFKGRINSRLFINGSSINSSVGLFDEDTPFLLRGKGSQRLVSMGLNIGVTDEGTVLLIDEIEAGLEPYRLRSLIGKLRTRIPSNGQVIMTTHSPVTVCECNVDELFIARSHVGTTTLTPMKAENITINEFVQSQVRKNPEAFLGRRLIVCKGKTEIGFIRALDSFLDFNHKFRMASEGVSYCLGNGDETIEVAKLFSSFGYEVCILMDSDKHADEIMEKELFDKWNIPTFAWEIGNSIEEQIFKDVPNEVAEELLQIPIDDKGFHLVAEKLKDVLDISVTGKFSLVGFTSDQRRHIGTISKANSKEKQSWYKRIDLGEEMGNVVFDNWSQIEDSTNLKTVLQKLIDWIIQ